MLSLLSHYLIVSCFKRGIFVLFFFSLILLKYTRTSISFIYRCIRILKKTINRELVGNVYVNNLSSDKYQTVCLYADEVIKNIRKCIIDTIAFMLLSSYECKLTKYRYLFPYTQFLVRNILTLLSLPETVVQISHDIQGLRTKQILN